MSSQTPDWVLFKNPRQKPNFLNPDLLNHRLHPNSFDVRKMVGCVCARSGESDKALEHFEYIAAREQEHQIDEEIYVEMGMIHEGRNAEKVGKLLQETPHVWSVFSSKKSMIQSRCIKVHD